MDVTPGRPGRPLPGTPNLKFWALNVGGLSLLMAAWMIGWVPNLISADKSYLTVLILCLVFVCLFLFVLDKPHTARWIGETLTTIGLLGTVIGIYMALGHIKFGGGLEQDVAGAAEIINGVGTAVSTTIFGLVGHLYVKLNHRILHAPVNSDSVY